MSGQIYCQPIKILANRQIINELKKIQVKSSCYGNNLKKNPHGVPCQRNLSSKVKLI